MTTNRLAPAILAVSLVLLTACGGPEADVPAVGEPESTTPAVVDVAEESAGMPRSESIGGASAFFITPVDGATVSNPISIEFGLEGMSLVPAGVNEPYSGHHHLLIDTELPALDQPIPADPNHIHFGDGSMSTEIDLAPGEHTLLLLLGDHLHVPHDPPVTSPTIVITVE